MVGIVLAYTHFIGLVAGVITGIFIQVNGPYIGEGIVLFVTEATTQSVSVLRRVDTDESSPRASKTD
jgi:hypothetical protein